jgi:hypothetical protein
MTSGIIGVMNWSKQHLAEDHCGLANVGLNQRGLRKIWGGNMLRLKTTIEAAAVKPSAG